MNKIKLNGLLLLLLLSAVSQYTSGAEYNKILIPAPCHPAVKSAAEIIARKLGLSEDAIKVAGDSAIPAEKQIMLTILPLTEAQSEFADSKIKVIKNDGYVIAFDSGAAIICGARPRSLLYAAGDVHLWKDKQSGTFIREPSFAIRTAEYHGSLPVAEYAAELGINLLIERGRATVSFKETLPDVYNQLSEQNKRRLDQPNPESDLAKACRDVDIQYYTFLYGNNFQQWSPALYEAALKAYPSVKGADAPASWKKASLCPSDPMTWKIIDAYLREFLRQTGADGLCATFWDNYGIYCQCDRCVETGMNKFPNQLYKCVKQYHEVL